VGEKVDEPDGRGLSPREDGRTGGRPVRLALQLDRVLPFRGVLQRSPRSGLREGPTARAATGT
jgi:hypothetical protein